MLKQYQDYIGKVYRLIDLAIIAGSWILAMQLRLLMPNQYLDLEIYWKLLPWVLIIWGVTLHIQRAYRSYRMLEPLEEVRVVFQSHALASLMLITLGYFVESTKYSRIFILLFIGLSLVGLVVERFVVRKSLRFLRTRGSNLRFAVIFGEGPAIEEIKSRFEKFPEVGLKILSVFSTNQVDQLENYIKTNSVDSVFVVLPRDKTQSFEAILNRVQNYPVSVHLVPDVLDYMILGCELESFLGLPLIHLNQSPLDGWAVIGKRATDIVLSFVGLVVLTPVLFLLALAVKITSKGPIFFRQHRMGLDGNLFQMLKFRTMQVSTTKNEAAEWTTANDSRRTSIGVFLRKSSLDELPQLWNVLKGEMSLVGPRPEQPYFVQVFQAKYPKYMFRHKVKSGITGWAQINGLRGDTSIEKRLEYDLFYIRNWSYALDVKIIFLTVFKGFANPNAY